MFLRARRLSVIHTSRPAAYTVHVFIPCPSLIPAEKAKISLPSYITNTRGVDPGPDPGPSGPSTHPGLDSGLDPGQRVCNCTCIPSYVAFPNRWQTKGSHIPQKTMGQSVAVKVNGPGNFLFFFIMLIYFYQIQYEHCNECKLRQKQKEDTLRG